MALDESSGHNKDAWITLDEGKDKHTVGLVCIGFGWIFLFLSICFGYFPRSQPFELRSIGRIIEINDIVGDVMGSAIDGWMTINDHFLTVVGVVEQVALIGLI